MRKMLLVLKSAFNRDNVLDTICILLFGITFFSMPAVSFMDNFNIITWGLSCLFVLACLINTFIKNKSIKINYVAFSFVLFAFFAVFSTALNGFKTFSFTPLLLALFSLIVYLTCLNNKKLINPFLTAAYVAVSFFSVYFLIYYRNEIISLSFERIGWHFGDLNDIALFMSLGLILSFYFFLNDKKIWRKIVHIFAFAVFTVCGTASGSKIFLLSIFIAVISNLFLFFGKKKWYISCIISIAFIGVSILVLSLKPFETIRNRFLSFISTFFGNNISGVSNNDQSSIQRFEMFLDGFSMFLRKPLFGFGIRGFWIFSSFTGAWSHNHFSEILCSYGLIGFVLFHVGFFDSFRGYKYSKTPYKNALMAMIVLFILSMFSIALESQKIYSYLIGVIFAGLSTEKHSFLLRIRKKLSNTSKDKKLVVVEMIQGLDTRGGAEVFFTNLCNEINKVENVDLHIVLLHDYVDNSFSSFVSKNSSIIHFCHKKNGVDFKSYVTLRKIIKEINPDIINTHLSCLISYFFAFGIKKRKWKIIHTVHNIASQETDSITSLIRKIYIRNNVLSFIGISPLVTQSVKDLFKKARVFTIFNGIPSLKEETENCFCGSSASFICPARFEQQKNHKMLFDVFDIYFNEYPNAKLYCFGDGTLFDESFNIVKQKCNPNNFLINHSVFDIGQCYKKANIFVLSSLYEGNPISILEAMSFGLPVIAPRTGGIPDVIKDGVNGLLFDVGDNTGMLNCLLKITKDEMLFNRISKQNKIDSSKYDISNTALQYIQMFRETIEKGK